MDNHNQSKIMMSVLSATLNFLVVVLAMITVFDVRFDPSIESYSLEILGTIAVLAYLDYVLLRKE